ALELQRGQRTFAGLPDVAEAEARALLRRYLSEKAAYGPTNVPTSVRASATIQRDLRGVPHISASDPYDLFFAHGYAQAQDRLWQMDYLRRWAHGRLSEVLGPEKLTEDIVARTLGITELSQELLEGSHAESRDMF